MPRTFIHVPCWQDKKLRSGAIYLLQALTTDFATYQHSQYAYSRDIIFIMPLSVFSIPRPVPLSTIRVPSLSDVPEERTPRTTDTSSHIKSLDGNMSTPSDSEAQLESRWHSHLHALKPGFRNAPPFRTWLRHSWLDILTQLLCLLVAEMIYLFAKPLLPRYFPLYGGVYKSAWGVAHGKPLLPEYITTLASAVISFAVPWVVIGAVGLWRVRDFWESHAAVCHTTTFPSPAISKSS